jgi:hypothetical protein
MCVGAEMRVNKKHKADESVLLFAQLFFWCIVCDLGYVVVIFLHRMNAIVSTFQADIPAL